MGLLATVLRGSVRSVAIPAGRDCVFCGEAIVCEEICPSCQSRPRVRALAVLLPRLAEVQDTPPNPLLAFSALHVERQLLAERFADIASVSLFGRYGDGHRGGIDARALTAFADGAFCGHYSCLLFDYFVEHEEALREAYRVVAPGGFFITHILHTRVVEGVMPPTAKSVIEPGPGYYEYIPDGQRMLSVRVGAGWFLGAMNRAGFKTTRYQVGDPCGLVCDWFVGRKPKPRGFFSRIRRPAAMASSS